MYIQLRAICEKETFVSTIMFLSVELVSFEYKRLVRVRNKTEIIFKSNLARVTVGALFNTSAKCPLLLVAVLLPLVTLFQLRYNPRFPSNLVHCPECF